MSDWILSLLVFSHQRVLFILGEEHDGISDEILKFHPALRISIPQLGAGRSFNSRLGVLPDSTEISKSSSEQLLE